MWGRSQLRPGLHQGFGRRSGGEVSTSSRSTLGFGDQAVSTHPHFSPYFDTTLQELVGIIPGDKVVAALANMKATRVIFK